MARKVFVSKYLDLDTPKTLMEDLKVFLTEAMLHGVPADKVELCTDTEGLEVYYYRDKTADEFAEDARRAQERAQREENIAREQYEKLKARFG
ncbi:hypothetical protein VPMG_00096 [Vibrio phage VBP32]|uniref:Uncharacterized protein n=2 Tax=Stoningtonvirus VBP47 TaxID=2846606 RepID=M4SL37_9CAUD|nr:hypothetical protein VPNG_00033 [Vibrio phage VBP47]YP_007676586.1 hypothetical protein VPMG_00096 [Vibrio phage VBP32]AGH57057.1 hypothetical protein VPNG_00033 [Vibrio phage VBP47]AGH57235.1 hypothetical protein VPMG_00096 [Vibrio phage VBP32]